MHLLDCALHEDDETKTHTKTRQTQNGTNCSGGTSMKAKPLGHGVRMVKRISEGHDKPLFRWERFSFFSVRLT